MCNTQKNSLLLNQHNGDDASQNYVAGVLEKLGYTIFKVKVGWCLIYVVRWVLGPVGVRKQASV